MADENSDTIRSRLDRLELAVIDLTAAVSKVVAQAENTAGRVVVILALMVSVLALATGGYAVASKLKADSERTTLRGETCAFIDSEHDRQRGEIVEGERRLYGQFAGVIKLTPHQKLLNHGNNRRKYLEVASTRPSYCPHRVPVPPYPTLEELGG